MGHERDFDGARKDGRGGRNFLPSGVISETFSALFWLHD
jgi:hypothetical protein